jgi:hypothetical protein
MTPPTFRIESYDENGLLKVEEIEIAEQPKEELIEEKEVEILRLLEELQTLKK